MHRWLVGNIFCRFFNFHIKRKRDCRFHQGKMMRRQSFILLFQHCFISMWNNVDDVWTICGSKNGSTRPLWTMWTIFRKKSVMKKFFLEKKNQKYCPQVHRATLPQPLRSFPGRGTALRNISDPRCLACYGITETICQGCAGIALAALPLTDGSGCANWQSGDGE